MREIPQAPVAGLDPVDVKPKFAYREQPKTKRPFGLREAPTLYPSKADFQDPYQYINSLYDLGNKYGILKIVPPPEWSPKFALDTGTFNFECRKQTLNTMGALTRSTMDWVRRMAKFHELRGSRIPDDELYPRVGYGSLNFYKLKEAVHKMGGFTYVCESQLWGAVAAKLELAARADTSAAEKLRTLYAKHLVPYEDYIAHASQRISSGLYRTKRTSPLFGSSLAPHLLTPTPPEDGRWPRRTVEVPSIEGASLLSPPPENKLQAVSGPHRRTRSQTIQKDEEEEAPRPTRRPRLSEQNLQAEEDSESDEDTSECLACSKEVPSSPGVLSCSECDNRFHAECIADDLSIDPYAKKWSCPQCLVGSGEFFFDEGETYDLYQFQEMANEFKEKYLDKELSIVDPNDREVLECLVEQNFWQHVNDVNCKISVEYGADIKCDVKGSGFPTSAKEPFNRYAKDPWNLNNFPHNKMSLFRNLKWDISGVTVPWAYVGMTFSAFCWHSEDHYTYSVNYQHFGDTKTWYGIPPGDAVKFEQASRELVPELFEKQPDLLFQRATMITPDILLSKGVQCYVADQHAGQFVVTFPNAYHSGFNHGFNFNEAVNYAPPNWVEAGHAASVSYKQQKREPVFSHDELLLRTARSDARVETAQWLHPHLLQMTKAEVSSRQGTRDRHPSLVTRSMTIGTSEETGFQCIKCRCQCFLSRLLVKGNEKEVYCHDDCPKSGALIMEIAFSDEELWSLCDELNERLEEAREEGKLDVNGPVMVTEEVLDAPDGGMRTMKSEPGSPPPATSTPKEEPSVPLSLQRLLH